MITSVLSRLSSPPRSRRCEPCGTPSQRGQHLAQRGVGRATVSGAARTRTFRTPARRRRSRPRRRLSCPDFRRQAHLDAKAAGDRASAARSDAAAGTDSTEQRHQPAANDDDANQNTKMRISTIGEMSMPPMSGSIRRIGRRNGSVMRLKSIPEGPHELVVGIDDIEGDQPAQHGAADDDPNVRDRSDTGR